MFDMKTHLTMAFIFVLAVAAEAGSLQQNKELVERFVAIGNAREFDRLGEVISEDFRRHCQATPDLKIESLAEFRSFMEQDAVVFPDSSVEVHQMIAEGDRVAIWATYTGTQATAMGPFPSYGKRMAVDFGAVFRIADGKLVELWVTWDNLAALSQLGHFPPPQPSP